MRAHSGVIGQRLAEIRFDRGLTQVELGRLIGRSKQYVWNIEHGSSMRINDARACARVLHCEVGDFRAEGPLPPLPAGWLTIWRRIKRREARLPREL